MKQYISKSDKETRKIAFGLAQKLNSNVISLTGELGAGKTTFVQGFAKGLKIKDKIISPTFVLIRQHKIPNTVKTLFHIDLYRLANNPSIKDLGLEEIWSNQNNIVLIEWAEKITNILPKNILKIVITKNDNSNRLITIY